MDRLNIPHNAFVFVGDGQRALFLRNIGDAKFPNLTVERVFSEQNPPTREQGTDRPGRGFKRAAQIAAAAWKQRIGMNWRSIVLLSVLHLRWRNWSAWKA